ANTGVAHFRGDTNTIKKHEEFLKDSVRVDIFGLKEGGTIDSPLQAPLRATTTADNGRGNRPPPTLKPGKRYLLEVVLRTLRVGHPLTQGTADSNELWVDVTAKSGNRVIGRSGGLGEHNEADPCSHFVNIY